MNRTFDIKTSLFRLPQGSSPTDKENTELVKRVIKSATGAENVKVGFHEGPGGDPLIDLYKIEAEFPRFLADGQYVSLSKQAALDGQAADLIGKIIKALASGQDASAEIQKLLEVSKGHKGEDEEGVKPEQGSASSGSPGGLPGQGGKGGFGGSSGGGFGGKSDGDKPKMPFANKQSNLKKAMMLEKYLGIPMPNGIKIAKQVNKKDFENFVIRIAAVKKEFGLGNSDAVEIVNTVDNSRNWADFYKQASVSLVDGNNKPFSNEEYVKIAAVARGEENPLV